MNRLNENYNIAKIGKNINDLRRKRGLTIKDLSEKVGISAGKLSGMENGKGNFFDDYIIRIAAALEVPKEDILTFETVLTNTDIQKLREKLTIANQLISTGMVQSSEKMLRELQEQIKVSHIDELLIEIYFSWAELYQIKEDEDAACEYYAMATEHTPHDSISTETKIRAFNALTCMEFKRGDYFTAMRYGRSAVNMFPFEHPVLTIDQANAHYNIAILYVWLQEFNLALHHAKKAFEITNEGVSAANQHTRYLLGIIYILRHEYDEAKTYLFEAMKWFQRQKDLQNIFNVFECLFILGKMRPAVTSEIFDLDLLTEFISLPVPLHLTKLKLRCIQKAISFLIRDQQYAVAGELLMICNGFEKQLPDDPLHSRTYYLYAQLARAIGEEEAEVKYLEKALSFLPLNHESQDKAIILFELAKKKEKGSSLFQQAGEIFYNQHFRNVRTLDSLIEASPKPRY